MRPKTAVGCGIALTPGESWDLSCEDLQLTILRTTGLVEPLGSCNRDNGLSVIPTGHIGLRDLAMAETCPSRY